MRLLYIAGPFSGPADADVLRNIERAAAVADWAWRDGAYGVVCPHLNSSVMHGTDVPHDRYYEADLALLSKCDAIAVLPHEGSKGAWAEVRMARALNLIVYTLTEDDVQFYLKNYREQKRSFHLAAT